MKSSLRRFASLAVSLSLLGLPLAARGDLLNRIDVEQQNGVGVIHILMTRPVIYTHHFPPDHSSLVHIFFNDLTLDRSNSGLSNRSMNDPAMDRNNPPSMPSANTEFMRGPRNDLVPVFWVSYSNHAAADAKLDPLHLMVQFAEPVHYKITADANNRGFLIFILSVDAHADTPSKPASTGADPAKTKQPDPSTSAAPTSAPDLPGSPDPSDTSAQ